MAASDKVEKELEKVKAIHDEDEKEDPPGSTTYIPVLPVDTCDTLESSGTCLSFSVNGRRIHIPPGGGTTVMKLHFSPGSSSSGFVTVRVDNCPAVMPSPPAYDCPPAPSSLGCTHATAGGRWTFLSGF